MKRDYRTFKWPEGWTFNKVLEFANERQLLEPGSKYPDFDRIHETVMAPITSKERDDELVKKARDEGYAQARKEFSESGTYVPAPGFGGMGSPQLKAKFGGIDKIPDESILNDPEVWGQIAQ